MLVFFGDNNGDWIFEGLLERFVFFNEFIEVKLFDLILLVVFWRFL